MLRLTPRQRRELIQVLAEEGPAGVEAWLRRAASQDPDIRARVEAERVELEREARAARRRLEARHAEEEHAAETSWEREMREAQEREAALRQRITELSAAPVLSQADLVQKSSLYRSVLAPDPLPWHRRLSASIRRFWILIVSLWVRFIRWVTGREPLAPRHVVTLPGGARVDLAGLGPDALVALRDEAPGWRQRLRGAWDRLLGREDYAEHVARLMEQERQRLEAAEQARRAVEQQRLDALLHEEDEKRVEAEKRRRREEEERMRRQQEELEQLAARAEAEPLRRLKEEILEDFEEAGLVDAQGNATEMLVSRFARSLYEEASRTLPAQGRSVPGTYVEGKGEYEVGPLHSQHEIGAMELVGSLVQARLRHPHQRHIYDTDVLVHREVRTAKAHVVLVFDTSGSMEEENRLEAAKRVCLVLHRAVKDRNPDHRVDLLRMHTSIERVDLAGCWNSKPTGFTNHGGAMREARRLLLEGGADQKLLYIVTDGLPEAYTKPDGTDKADRPDVCMEDALREARRLRGVPGLVTTILQLSNEPQYLDAARRIAKAAGGRVEAVDPKDLLQWMLGDYEAAASPMAV